MKGSITFKFNGATEGYSIRTLREGELDNRDLEAIAALLEEEIRLNRLIALGKIVPTVSDPRGVGQLHDHWSN